jgi:hypothetical protein
MLVMSERFANQTLQVIAPHGTADDACRNRKSQTSMRDIIATNENGEQRIGETSRILIDAVEVRFVMESLRRSERPGESLQVTRGKAVEPTGPLDAQALATFRAATSKHLPAATGCHTRTKTVRALTTNFAGLISAFHAQSRC